MSWSAWALAYIGVGVAVVLTVASTHDLRDAFEYISAVFVWPAIIVMYPIGKIRKWRRERERQAHITAEVAKGSYTAEWAREAYNWKG